MKYLFSLLLTLCLSLAYSQNIAPQFKGIRSMQIGNIASNAIGIHASFSNPAGLAKLSTISAYIGAENRYEIPELTAFQVAVAGPASKYGVFGLNLTNFGTQLYTDQKIGLIYARRLFDNLTLAVQFDWLHIRIGEYGHTDHFSFDIGMQSDINKKLQLGIHLFSPYGMNFDQSRKIPTVIALGIRYRISTQVQVFCESEKNLYHPLQLKAGVSYQLLPAFTLSIGMFTQSRVANICGGFSYRFREHIEIDTGISYHQYLGISSGIGISYVLKRKESP